MIIILRHEEIEPTYSINSRLLHDQFGINAIFDLRSINLKDIKLWTEVCHKHMMVYVNGQTIMTKDKLFSRLKLAQGKGYHVVALYDHISWSLLSKWLQGIDYTDITQKLEDAQLSNGKVSQNDTQDIRRFDDFGPELCLRPSDRWSTMFCHNGQNISAENFKRGGSRLRMEIEGTDERVTYFSYYDKNLDQTIIRWDCPMRVVKRLDPNETARGSGRGGGLAKILNLFLAGREISYHPANVQALEEFKALVNHAYEINREQGEIEATVWFQNMVEVLTDSSLTYVAPYDGMLLDYNGEEKSNEDLDHEIKLNQHAEQDIYEQLMNIPGSVGVRDQWQLVYAAEYKFDPQCEDPNEAVQIVSEWSAYHSLPNKIHPMHTDIARHERNLIKKAQSKEQVQVRQLINLLNKYYKVESKKETEEVMILIHNPQVGLDTGCVQTLQDAKEYIKLQRKIKRTEGDRFIQRKFSVTKRHIDLSAAAARKRLWRVYNMGKAIVDNTICVIPSGQSDWEAQSNTAELTSQFDRSSYDWIIESDPENVHFDYDVEEFTLGELEAEMI